MVEDGCFGWKLGWNHSVVMVCFSKEKWSVSPKNKFLSEGTCGWEVNALIRLGL